MFKLSFVLLFVTVLSPLASVSRAQEMRVYTRVSDVADDGGKPSRSLSLFHHGRVYDYIPAADEVTILEPAHNRFTLLNAGRNIATTVEFDEIQRILKVSGDVVRARVTELDGESDRAARDVVEFLKFQLDPKFEPLFNESRGTLQLKSRMLIYSVEATVPQDTSVVTLWAKYADWTARLNYVLHPGAVLPAPRLALNAMMRQKKMIPTRVELQTNIAPKRHLRAEHRIDWELDPGSLTLINRWETLLRSRTVKRVTFAQYQRTLLTADGSR